MKKKRNLRNKIEKIKSLLESLKNDDIRFFFSYISIGETLNDVHSECMMNLNEDLISKALKLVIDDRLFENEKALQEDEIPDETILRVMKRNNPNMYSFINDEVNIVIRMGGPEKVEQRINNSKPQSFLLAKPSEAGEEQI